MNKSVNTEEIMSQLKRDIKEKNIPDFEDIPYKKYSGSEVPENPDNAIKSVRAYSYVHPYRQFSGNTLKVFLKKSVRKIIKFYIEPIVNEQNNFNSSTETALTSMRNTQKKLIRRIEKLEKENKRLMQDLYGE
ncbi:MAG: hypothetical protein NC040_02105 [Muribaculaceae bacterium]|nr:hypothetical protein [Alistipes senegalensis]MCM1472823.1 hypothetical protein [Muribaculaceae bacterium]